MTLMKSKFKGQNGKFTKDQLLYLEKGIMVYLSIP